MRVVVLITLLGLCTSFNSLIISPRFIFCSKFSLLAKPKRSTSSMEEGSGGNKKYKEKLKIRRDPLGHVVPKDARLRRKKLQSGGSGGR